MRSWISACLCLITLFLTKGMAQSIFGDGPNQYLKGIHAINYSTAFENGMVGSRCAINEQEWATSLKFVVNQSAKLKFIDDEEYHNQATELGDEASLLAKNAIEKSSTAQLDAAAMKLHEYVSIPKLFITITPIELEGGCAGTLNGELSVAVAPTNIIATKAMVYHPTITIWSFGHTMKGPHQSFSAFMIRTGEQLIKKLVNSWTDSQKF